MQDKITSRGPQILSFIFGVTIDSVFCDLESASSLQREQCASSSNENIKRPFSAFRFVSSGCLIQYEILSVRTL